MLAQVHALQDQGHEASLAEDVLCLKRREGEALRIPAQSAQAPQPM